MYTQLFCEKNAMAKLFSGVQPQWESCFQTHFFCHTFTLCILICIGVGARHFIQITVAHTKHPKISADVKRVPQQGSPADMWLGCRNRRRSGCQNQTGSTDAVSQVVRHPTDAQFDHKHPMPTCDHLAYSKVNRCDLYVPSTLIPPGPFPNPPFGSAIRH